MLPVGVAHALQPSRDCLEPFVAIHVRDGDTGRGGALGDDAIHPLGQAHPLPAGRFAGGFTCIKSDTFDAPRNGFVHVAFRRDADPE
jgi:hypothetical protein